MNPAKTFTAKLTPTTDRPASLYLIAAGLLAGLLVGLTGCQQTEAPDGPSEEANGKPVRVATVEYGAIPTLLRLPGATRAVERAELAFLNNGHLAERLVKRGDRVNTGDALAILHNPALMPGVSSAEARVREIDRQLEQLGRETQRLENLHERGLIATDDLDRTRSRRDALLESRQAAEAALGEARDQLEEGTLRAPFAAEIVELHTEPGQYVAPGQPIVTISASDRLEVALSIPSRQAKQLVAGQSVVIRAVDEPAWLSGEITEIGPGAPGQPARGIVTLPPLPGSAWQPGLAVQIDIESPGETRLSVPMAAVIRPATGSPRVFRIRDGVAERIEVTPGQLHDGRVTINGELAAGDEIVIAGHGQLLDGDRVRVLR